MTLRLDQEATLESTIASTSSSAPLGWWRWRVWIAGDDAELERVEWVRYQLHPTFPEPTRIVQDRASRFELQGSGWGEFTIYACAHLEDGSDQEFRHWLRLAGAPRAGEAPAAGTLGGQAPKLFLSYGFADTHLAQAVGAALRTQGVQVLDPNARLQAGADWASAMGDLLEEADVAAVFISGRVGPWLENEIHRLREREVDLLPIVVAGTTFPDVPEELRVYGPLPVKTGEDPAAIAARILQQMPALRSLASPG